MLNDRLPADPLQLLSSGPFFLLPFGVCAGCKLHGGTCLLDSFGCADIWGHYYITADYSGIL